MLNTIIDKVEGMELTSDKTKQMKEEILERKSFVEEAIEKAY